MSHQPERQPPRSGPAKKNKEWILFAILAVFIVAAIAGMMAFDQYGEAQAGRMGDVKGAPEQ